ncbi:uncharacterized protein LOC110032583 [Phalaenopsis equestris]|uniref:uncharacterized protein LOC110032583 n=1 Tax=Phalaenopsis equestris TaxID=78828 RepID=UPI0009E3168B|nr:uncharacterized protein LOC110032583 [Phalaenopsis equestris]
MDLIADDGQFVTVCFNNTIDNFSGWLTFVYASTSTSARYELWNKINCLVNVINDKWMVGGDFNMILNSTEKLGGRRAVPSLMNNFSKTMVDAGLVYLGLIGSKYTWKQGLVADNWNVADVGNAWFRLWKLHKKVASALRAWNWEVFGDVHARVIKAERMVQHLQAIDESSNDVVSQLQNAHNELLAASIQEEELLQQKAGEVHFVHGDRNTKYFHACIKQRRANNTIIRIKDECGNWITGNRDLGVSAVQYFQNLFLPSQNTGTIDSALFNDVRDYTDNLELCGIMTANDIFQVLSEINCNKAPGPDGFTSDFYLKSWNIIQNDVVQANQSFFKGDT